MLRPFDAILVSDLVVSCDTNKAIVNYACSVYTFFGLTSWDLAEIS